MIISRKRFEREMAAAVDKAYQDFYKDQERQRDQEYIRRDIYRLMERVDKLEKEVYGQAPDKNLEPVRNF